jgi:hypothetical protein
VAQVNPVLPQQQQKQAAQRRTGSNRANSAAAGHAKITMLKTSAVKMV